MKQEGSQKKNVSDFDDATARLKAHQNASKERKTKRGILNNKTPTVVFNSSVESGLMVDNTQSGTNQYYSDDKSNPEMQYEYKYWTQSELIKIKDHFRAEIHTLSKEWGEIKSDFKILKEKVNTFQAIILVGVTAIVAIGIFLCNKIDRVSTAPNILNTPKTSEQESTVHQKNVKVPDANSQTDSLKSIKQ